MKHSPQSVSACDTDLGERISSAVDVPRAIAKLPEKRRDAVTAILLDDKHPAIYAAANKVSEKTARNNVDQAKPQLRRELADYQ